MLYCYRFRVVVGNSKRFKDQLFSFLKNQVLRILCICYRVLLYVQFIYGVCIEKSFLNDSVNMKVVVKLKNIEKIRNIWQLYFLVLFFWWFFKVFYQLVNIRSYSFFRDRNCFFLRFCRGIFFGDGVGRDIRIIYFDSRNGRYGIYSLFFKMMRFGYCV